MKKKTFMKNAVALVLALVLLINPMQVFSEELPTEAVYDLEKGGTQTFVIRDQDGNVNTVTVRELDGNSRVANGEYEVGCQQAGAWIASFIISVSSNKIYNAHSPFCHAYVGTIKYPAIARPSTSYAYYAFIYEVSMINFSTGVDARINNGEIVISRR